MTENLDTILLTGATGFVGRHVLPVLEAAGLSVRCATRDPERAAARDPDRDWVLLDVERSETLGPALAGCRAALYLVHGMGGGGDFEAREDASAAAFAAAAAAAGLERIVYLGGVAPTGEGSKHLRSRLRTGETLRAGAVPTLELRAGMIVGAGSISWQMVRDLALRLPAMVLPRWLRNASQPVAIRDVVAALVAGLTVPLDGPACCDLPGPEVLSARDVLMRVAALGGRRPLTVDVPILSPRLSSHWIRLVSRADYGVAAKLVEGLTSDLVVPGPGFWAQMPGHTLQPFDAAARDALGADAVGPVAATFERAVALITPPAPTAAELAGSPARTALFVGGCVAFAMAHAWTGSTGPWVPLAIAAALVLLATGLFDRGLLRPGPRWGVRFAGGLAAGGLMAALTHGVYGVVAPGIAGLSAEVSALYAWTHDTPPGPPLTLGLLGIVVLAEELVWRGAGFLAVRARWGDAGALVLPTLAYAVVHAGARSLLLVPVAGGCGLIWALVRLRGGLAASLACHLVWSGLVLSLWPLAS